MHLMKHREMQLPGLIYKKILNQSVDLRDLKLIDKFLVDYLDNVRKAPSDPGMTTG